MRGSTAGTSFLFALGTFFVLVAMLLVVMGVVENLRQVLAASLLLAAGLSLVRAHNRSRSSGA
ncbi:hypothetical protein BH23ACT5_BH23ACT5_08230 [soil metagenome]